MLTHGTLSGYNKHGCRCDECRAAKAAYQREHGSNRRSTPARAAQKRRWDQENRPVCECGQPMSARAERCADCKRRDDQAYQRLVEDMWAEGMTARQIANALGWKTRNPNTHIVQLRRRGYSLPHRRTPEQLARITAGSDGRLARARAVYRAQRKTGAP